MSKATAAARGEAHRTVAIRTEEFMCICAVEEIGHMKTRVSVKDVLALDESQRRSLRLLWTPQPCDVAVALICRDVENDVYEPVVFAVGEISVTRHGTTILGNLAYDAMAAISLPDGFDEYDDDLDSEHDGGASGTEDADGFEEQQRTPFAGGSFPKDECLPLLDIGQMISILVGRHYSYRIRLEIAPERIACSIDGQESGPEELCDALWEAVCALL
jgi:hypothetical protein